MIGEKYRNFREVVEDPRINFRMLFNYVLYEVRMTIKYRKSHFP